VIRARFRKKAILEVYYGSLSIATKRKVSTINQLAGKHSGLPLFAGAFLMALSLSSWWTVMPFIIRFLGGSETHVGLAPAVHMGGYLASRKEWA
jgi:hypothetical protein